jgi:hypothetical protein
MHEGIARKRITFQVRADLAEGFWVRFGGPEPDEAHALSGFGPFFSVRKRLVFAVDAESGCSLSPTATLAMSDEW